MAPVYYPVHELCRQVCPGLRGRKGGRWLLLADHVECRICFVETMHDEIYSLQRATGSDECAAASIDGIGVAQGVGSTRVVATLVF
jgi:hypothetical protein